MNPLRNESTARPLEREMMPSDLTTLDEQAWDEISGKHNPTQHFRLLRLCVCETCGGRGKIEPVAAMIGGEVINAPTSIRCQTCRGEGRVLQLVATAATPEAIGTALVTLAQEGEFEDCPLGLLQLDAEPGKRWLIRPWQASPRNLSDAGKLLRSAQTKEKP